MVPSSVDAVWRDIHCIASVGGVQQARDGGGDDAHGEYIDGVVADDALGDWETGVSSGAHGGAGF